MHQIIVTWRGIDLNVLQAGEKKNLRASAEMEIHYDTGILERAVMKIAGRRSDNLFSGTPFQGDRIMRQLFEALQTPDGAADSDFYLSAAYREHQAAGSQSLKGVRSGKIKRIQIAE